MPKSHNHGKPSKNRSKPLFYHKLSVTLVAITRFQNQTILKMNNPLNSDHQYKQWLKEVKQRIRESQIKATIRVNTTLMELYWSIGADIVNRQSALPSIEEVEAQLSTPEDLSL